MSTHSLEVEVALVRKDVEQIKMVHQKLDIAIEKMGEVSNSIGKMLVAHEERLGFHDRSDKELFEMLDSTKEEFQESVAQIGQRIEATKTELSQKVQTSEHRITKTITDMNTENKEQFKSIDTRLASLEKWRFLLIGGGTVIGFLLTKLIEFLVK